MIKISTKFFLLLKVCGDKLVIVQLADIETNQKHWHWASIPMVVGSNPTVARHIFQASRCGYTLRVTSHKQLIHLSTLHQHSKFHDY